MRLRSGTSYYISSNEVQVGPEIYVEPAPSHEIDARRHKQINHAKPFKPQTTTTSHRTIYTCKRCKKQCENTFGYCCFCSDKRPFISLFNKNSYIAYLDTPTFVNRSFYYCPTCKHT